MGAGWLSAADDATIVSGFVEKGARVVNLQFFVWKVSNISTVDQTFQCRFNLRASYSEEKSKLQHSQDLPQWGGSLSEALSGQQP